MNLFLDTEFADPEATELVSLALVSQDGKHVFYAERATLPVRATEFVEQHVYPLLDRGAAALDDTALTTRLRRFLASVPDPHVIYDYPGDWFLLRWAINGLDLPKAAAAKCGRIPEFVVTLVQGGPVFEETEAWFAAHPQARRHHALVDAHALRFAWIEVHGAE